MLFALAECQNKCAELSTELDRQKRVCDEMRRDLSACQSRAALLRRQKAELLQKNTILTNRVNIQNTIYYEAITRNFRLYQQLVHQTLQEDA